MKRTKLFTTFTVVLLLALTPLSARAESVGAINMYRLYNANTGEHFYTSSADERDSLEGVGWKYEGVGWRSPEKSDTPVYRLYNPHVIGGDHHYTTNANERDMLCSAGWSYEGIGWYSDDGKAVPVYREYNPNAYSGTHNYTSSLKEHNNLVKAGWRDENIAWYGVSKYVGEWSGELYKAIAYGSGKCLGGEVYPPEVTVLSYDPRLRVAKVSIRFLVHNHAATPSGNAVASSAGDQVISLQNVLLAYDSGTAGFDINVVYEGEIGSGYLHDNKGCNDSYKIRLFNSGDDLELEVYTSSVFSSYSRQDFYSLSQTR